MSRMHSSRKWSTTTLVLVGLAFCFSFWFICVCVAEDSNPPGHSLLPKDTKPVLEFCLGNLAGAKVGCVRVPYDIQAMQEWLANTKWNPFSGPGAGAESTSPSRGPSIPENECFHSSSGTGTGESDSPTCTGGGSVLPPLPYDFRLLTGPIEDLRPSGTGWRVQFGGNLTHWLTMKKLNGVPLEKIEKEFFVGVALAIIGKFNDGKTFLTCLLHGLRPSQCPFDSGFSKSTQGLSVSKSPLTSSKDMIVLDIAGRGVPVDRLDSELLSNEAITEEVLGELGFKLSFLQLAVFGDMTRDDQLYLMDIVKKINTAGRSNTFGFDLESPKDEKRLAVVHNLKHITVEEFFQYFRTRLFNKFPQFRCESIDKSLTDPLVAKLKSHPPTAATLTEGLCANLRAGEFYATSHIHGIELNHFFLLSEIAGDATQQRLAMAFNDVMITHLKLKLTHWVPNKQFTTEVPIISETLQIIQEMLPKYIRTIDSQQVPSNNSSTPSASESSTQTNQTEANYGVDPNLDSESDSIPALSSDYIPGMPIHFTEDFRMRNFGGDLGIATLPDSRPQPKLRVYIAPGAGSGIPTHYAVELETPGISNENDVSVTVDPLDARMYKVVVQQPGALLPFVDPTTSQSSSDVSSTRFSAACKNCFTEVYSNRQFGDLRMSVQVPKSMMIGDEPIKCYSKGVVTIVWTHAPAAKKHKVTCEELLLPHKFNITYDWEAIRRRVDQPSPNSNVQSGGGKMATTADWIRQAIASGYNWLSHKPSADGS